MRLRDRRLRDKILRETRETESDGDERLREIHKIERQERLRKTKEIESEGD